MASFRQKQGIHSTASSQDNNWSFVFFPKTNGVLECLTFKGKEAGDEPTEPKYEASSIVVGKDVVSASGGNTQLAAITYKSGDGSVQVRLYYIDEDEQLKELCNSIGSNGLGTWKRGSLDNARFNADPKSPLSASVDQEFTNQIKLYYCRTDEAGLWCTFVHIDSQGWTPRSIT